MEHLARAFVQASTLITCLQLCSSHFQIRVTAFMTDAPACLRLYVETVSANIQTWENRLHEPGTPAHLLDLPER